MDHGSLMREWAGGPFRLELHGLVQSCETSQRWREDRKTPIGYRFYHDDQLIFEGHDIPVPDGQTLDGDQTVRGVLEYLALRPGDVEADYFRGYTPAADQVIGMVGGAGVIGSIYPADQVLADGERFAAIDGAPDPRLAPPLAFGLGLSDEPPDDDDDFGWDRP